MKKIIGVLLFSFLFTPKIFSQVTLVGAFNGSFNIAGINIFYDVAGNARFYYSGKMSYAPATTLDSLTFYDLNTCLPLYQTNIIYITPSWIVDINGFPAVLSGNQIVDLKTGNTVYSWANKGSVVTAYINPSDNSIRVLIATYNSSSNTNSYSVYSLGTYSPPPGVSQNLSTLPKRLSVAQNYPNPFNPSTIIQYSIPVQSHVTVQVFNIKGQLVRSLVNENKPSGSYNIQWDGNSDSGGKVSSGVYFYSVKSGDQELTRKMVMIK